MTTNVIPSEQADDPLSPVSGRFALSRSTVELPVTDAKPTRSAARPFGLRTGEERDPHVASPLAYRYCPQRQIAVTLTEPAVAIHEQVAGWTHTTIASKDGQTPGQEEWKMDPTFADEP